jgi:hypothetical protein
MSGKCSLKIRNWQVKDFHGGSYMIYASCNSIQILDFSLRNSTSTCISDESEISNFIILQGRISLRNISLDSFKMCDSSY